MQSTPLRRALSLSLLCTVALAIYCGHDTSQVHAVVSDRPEVQAADERCASCHAAIVKQYRESSMARGSGIAGQALIAGSFTHPDSGMSYRIDTHDGQVRLRYERTDTSRGAPIAGEERLQYFIGSGKRGRTYLFERSLPGQEASLWFEAPVNWYTRRASYDMAPAFDHATVAPLALPVEPNCLHCHATGVAEPIASTPNAYSGAPFQQGGIACSSCHGSAEAHLRSGGKTPMLRLASIAPARQDSVCLQCHLEGDATVQRAGRSLAKFQPGDLLSDSALYFVRASASGSMLRASSQYEALLRSACRRGAGERLTCVTCHDPHGEPAPAERVSFYRAKCLQCHSDGPSFTAATHHPEQPDCASCHMPARKTADISHEQTVDHNIEAVPATAGTSASSLLLAVGNVNAGERERGLAYAQFAARGDREAFTRAWDLLHKAEFNGADDAVLHEQIGYLAQMRGRTDEARKEYARALKQDPNLATALADLAVLEAQAGETAGAEQHLRTVAHNDPSQTAALLNLALLRCRAGGTAESADLLRLALRFNPDSPEAQHFLATGDYAGTHCAVR